MQAASCSRVIRQLLATDGGALGGGGSSATGCSAAMASMTMEAASTRCGSGAGTCHHGCWPLQPTTAALTQAGCPSPQPSLPPIPTNPLPPPPLLCPQVFVERKTHREAWTGERSVKVGPAASEGSGGVLRAGSCWDLQQCTGLPSGAAVPGTCVASSWAAAALQPWVCPAPPAVPMQARACSAAAAQLPSARTPAQLLAAFGSCSINAGWLWVLQQLTVAVQLHKFTTPLSRFRCLRPRQQVAGERCDGCVAGALW
jgi:hypothetical protein